MLFTAEQLQLYIPRLQEEHPFLPDRHWLNEAIKTKLNQLATQLNSDQYIFNSAKIYNEWHGKPVPTLQLSTPDWLVQYALTDYLENSLATHLLPHTYYQIKDIQSLVTQCQDWQTKYENCWVFRADIKGFFRNISIPVLHQSMMNILTEPVVENLIDQWLSVVSLSKEQGLPVGASLNYVLANWYLQPIDKFMKTETSVAYLARYVDDWLIGVKDAATGRLLMQELESKLEILGLQLNKDKSTLYPPNTPFVFLGASIC